MFADISPHIKTVQNEKHVVHCFYWCCTDSVRSIGHNALNERRNTFLIVIKHWPDHLYQFIEYHFVWSLNIRVVKTRCINKRHIPSSAYFDTWCDRFIRLSTLKITWDLTLSVMCTINLRKGREYGWLALTTLTEDTSCPFVNRLFNVEYLLIRFQQFFTFNLFFFLHLRFFRSLIFNLLPFLPIFLIALSILMI